MKATKRDSREAIRAFHHEMQAFMVKYPDREEQAAAAIEMLYDAHQAGQFDNVVTILSDWRFGWASLAEVATMAQAAAQA